MSLLLLMLVLEWEGLWHDVGHIPPQLVHKWDHYAFTLTHIIFSTPHCPVGPVLTEPIFASQRKLATCFMDHMRGVLWNGIPKTLSQAQAIAGHSDIK